MTIDWLPIALIAVPGALSVVSAVLATVQHTHRRHQRDREHIAAAYGAP